MYQKIRSILYRNGYMNSPLQKFWVLLQKPFEKTMKVNKIKSVHRKGEKLLREFNSITQELNINCWLEFGTLLGAYRDKSFISFDYDIDMGMYAKDFTSEFQNILKEKGFRAVKCYYLVDVKNQSKNISEMTYKYNGIYFDVFLSYEKGEKRQLNVYTTCIDDVDTKFNCRQYCLDNANELVDVYINGIKCKSPGNPHNYLSSIYGENYMTPIQGWKQSNTNPVMKMLDSNLFYGLLYRY